MASSLTPMATGSPMHPVYTGDPTTLVAVESSSTPCPCQGGLVCSGAALGSDPCGWPSCRGKA